MGFYGLRLRGLELALLLAMTGLATVRAVVLLALCVLRVLVPHARWLVGLVLGLVDQLDLVAELDDKGLVIDGEVVSVRDFTRKGNVT